MSSRRETVLILGAGINGCALARELLLNRVPVCLVDTADICFGATAYSSRLIHGGLRYLEYGEFDLVRESLAERTRLLRLAPQFVKPLELFIPAAAHFGGLLSAAGRFLHWRWWPLAKRSSERGLSLIRMGLWLYDLYARDPTLPKHRVHAVGSPAAPAGDAQKFRWLASYYDAQILFPERFVLALLADARRLADENAVDFELYTYHRATLKDRLAEIRPVDSEQVVATLEPAIVVNATGSWVDLTLEKLGAASRRLMGGSKGSHLFTYQPRLSQALNGRGIYAEARDGRPIFITPLGATTLVGTTDEPFDRRPEKAVATGRELEYLLDAVNAIFPDVHLAAEDIAFHYSGVRPLPFADRSTPGAVTRRHWLEKSSDSVVPLYSVIGGKLTTCRSLAEQAAQALLRQLQRPVVANSRERVVPGGEDYPADAPALRLRQSDLAREFGLPLAAIQATWNLVGARTGEVLAEGGGANQLLPDTDLPEALARWSIRHESPRKLSDLVERRLMLIYHQRLTRRCLRRLAELMGEADLIDVAACEDEVRATVRRLEHHFGKRLEN